jgi:hypothetical protein
MERVFQEWMDRLAQCYVAVGGLTEGAQKSLRMIQVLLDQFRDANSPSAWYKWSAISLKFFERISPRPVDHYANLESVSFLRPESLTFGWQHGIAV